MPRLLFSIQHSSFSNDLHPFRLFFPEAQVVAAEAEFDGIAQRGPADDFDFGAVAEAHLEQSPAEVGIAAHGKDAPPASDAQLIQAARLGGFTMIAGRKSTCLLHTTDLLQNQAGAIIIHTPEGYRPDQYKPLRLSFNATSLLIRTECTHCCRWANDSVFSCIM